MYCTESGFYVRHHKVHIYIEYQKGGGGYTLARVRGWGSPNSDDWRKGLALCLLCDMAQC